MNYTQTDEYQKEIAEQYSKRNLQLGPDEVSNILSLIGFEVSATELSEATAGNMNATFLSSKYAIKINKDKQHIKFAANKIVSSALPSDKVVKVLAHDVYEKTDYEVLVMERTLGTEWLHTLPKLSEEINISIFDQVLGVVNNMRNISFTEKFGWITDIYQDSEKNGFSTYSAQLKARLEAYKEKIDNFSYLEKAKVEEVFAFAHSHLPIFENEKAEFVHNDLHMGNVLHTDDQLASIIDFDSCISAPFYASLIPIVGLIDNPSQFVEGTPEHKNYKDRKLEYLYPTLYSHFENELNDTELPLKLNTIGVIDGLMWISQDWSKQWNIEMMSSLVNKEITPNTSETYFGSIIQKIRK